MELEEALVECIEISAIDIWEEITFAPLYDIGEGGFFNVEEIRIPLNAIKYIKKLGNRYDSGNRFVGKNSILYLKYPYHQQIINHCNSILVSGFLISIKFRDEMQYEPLEVFVEKLNLSIESEGAFENWTFKYVCCNDRIGAKMYLFKI